jgi:hypothetical protein
MGWPRPLLENIKPIISPNDSIPPSKNCIENINIAMIHDATTFLFFPQMIDPLKTISGGINEIV